MIWCSLSLISSHFKQMDQQMIDRWKPSEPTRTIDIIQSFSWRRETLRETKVEACLWPIPPKHCINWAPRGTSHSLMLFLVITRLSPGRGILLPHHLPSPLWPLLVSPSNKNLKSLKARSQSYPKPFRVIQSLPESAKAFQSQPKPSRVSQSLPESSKVIQILFYFILFLYLYLFIF